MADRKALRFHTVTPGEAILADGSVVLEMRLAGSMGVILYDRRRRLAAACQVRADGEAARLREMLDAASLGLLVRMIQRGSDPEHLEIFALGTGEGPAGGPWPAGAELPLPQGRVALAYSTSESGQCRRVEFDVAAGRIVIEEGPPAGPGG